MAPTRPATSKRKHGGKGKIRAKKAASAAAEAPNVYPKDSLASASEKLAMGDAETAAPIALQALEHIPAGSPLMSLALSLLGHIFVDLGDVERARGYFLHAVEVEEEEEKKKGRGAGDNRSATTNHKVKIEGMLQGNDSAGAEKFLWLAQLSEEGGQDSVSWFERGAEALRAQICALEHALACEATPPLARHHRLEAAAKERRTKLAETLCAVAEVYMTDLSWEVDAEARCDALVTEATMLAPDLPETWQTVANVRISQQKDAEARTALGRCLALLKDLPPGDDAVSPFPTRVGLVRHLIEVGMERDAIDVAADLVDEDDQAAEVWYLGGYGRFVLGEKMKNGEVKAEEAEGREKLWRSAYKWLAQCMNLFAAQGCEDEQLGQHAEELMGKIKEELGEMRVDGQEEEEEGDEEGGEEDGEGEDDGGGWEDMDEETK